MSQYSLYNQQYCHSIYTTRCAIRRNDVIRWAVCVSLDQHWVSHIDSLSHLILKTPVKIGKHTAPSTSTFVTIANYKFLSASANLWNSTTVFYTSVRPSVHVTLLPLDGFSWNLIFEYFFRKTVQKIQIKLKPDKNIGYFTGRKI